MSVFLMSPFLQTCHAYWQLSRFDKPIGAWLVLFPALWGLVLGHGALPPLSDIILFTVGAFLVRGAGCTANDLMDRNLDPLVERTKDRPLARGALTTRQGIASLCVQLLMAASLLLFMPVEVFYLSLVAVVLMLVYPLLKRITYWPQLFLGFCMNYSLLMAYVFVTRHLSLEVLILYGGSVFWTLAYDTLYGHQDKKDDLRAGIKSSALSFVGSSKVFLGGGYALFIAAIGGVLIRRGLHVASLGLLLMPASLLGYQLYLVRFHNPQRCLKAFKMNGWVGLFVWGVLVLSLSFF